MAAMRHRRNWRTRLTRDVGRWSLVKFAALVVLWALFFSGSHRCRVDASAAAGRLALQSEPGGGRCDRF
jgi:hypothetical protein